MILVKAVYRFIQIQLHRAPLLLPLLALLGVLLPLLGASGWWALLALVAFLLALLYREWKVLLGSLLVSTLGYCHLAGLQKHESMLGNYLLSQDVVTLQGQLVRKSVQSGFLQLDDSAVKVELRGELFKGELGDAIRCVGKAYPLEEAHLPGTFDRASWLRSQGVLLSVEVFDCQASPEGWRWSKLYALSDRLRAAAMQYLMPAGTEGEPQRQVLCALLLGERRAAEPEILEAFQWSGTMHAFAVSGLHVGIVASLLWFVFFLLRLPPKLAQSLILLALAAYVFVTGMAISSLRAYFIILLVMVGIMKRRQVMILNIFCAVALLVLLIAPRHLLQAGFLLSFAVYGTICLAAWVGRGESAWFAPDEYLPEDLYHRGHRFLKSSDAMLRGLFVVSLSAYLVSLPIMVSYFGSYNSYGALANICIAPLLPICMGLGLLSLIPYLGLWVLPLALKMSGLLLSICSFFAALPASHVSAVMPQPASAYVCLGLRYEQSASVLGNPGLLVSSANAQTARWSVCPACSAAGFKAGLALNLESFSKDDALAYIQAFWPGLRRVEPGPSTYNYGENSYTLYPAVVEMKSPRIRDHFPIIHWRHPAGAVLYLGDASASSFYAWKSQGVDLRADVAIIGYNDKQPLTDVEALQELGVREIILLPNAPNYLYEQSESLRLRQVHENEALHGDLGKNGAN